jgi:hypothetical protein
MSINDEDEKLRAYLAQPLSPVPTLDPFLPRPTYTGPHMPSNEDVIWLLIKLVYKAVLAEGITVRLEILVRY